MGCGNKQYTFMIMINHSTHTLKLTVTADSGWDFQISSLSENTVWHSVTDADVLECQAGAEKSQSMHKNPRVK